MQSPLEWDAALTQRFRPIQRGYTPKNQTLGVIDDAIIRKNSQLILAMETSGIISPKISSCITGGLKLQDILDQDVAKSLLSDDGLQIDLLIKYQCINEDTFSCILKQVITDDMARLIRYWTSISIPIFKKDVHILRQAIIHFPITGSFTALRILTEARENLEATDLLFDFE